MRPVVSILRGCLLALCAVITLFGYKIVSNSVHDSSQKAFDTLSADSRDAILDRLRFYQQTLNSFVGLFAAQGDVSAAEFQRFASQLGITSRRDGIDGLGVVEPVKSSEVAAFLAKIKADGITTFTIHPRATDDEMFVIRSIEPIEDNEYLLGLNISPDAGTRQAAERARDSGLAQLSSPLALPKAGQADPVFLLFQPIYRNGSAVGTVEQRRAAFVGWVFAVLGDQHQIRDAASSADQPNNLSIYFGDRVEAASLVYRNFGPTSSDSTPQFTKVDRFDVFGQTFTAQWVSTPAFETAYTSSAPMLTLITAILFSAFFIQMFWFLARRDDAIQRQVVDKTIALNNSESENRAIVDKAPLGILTLDASGIVLRCNDAAIEVLSRSQEETVGHQVRDILPNLDMNSQQGKCRYRPLNSEGADRVFDYSASDWNTDDYDSRTTLFLRDITKEAKVYQEVAETERRWDLALKGADIGVFDINLVAGKSVVSDSWRRIMGLSLDDGNLDSQAEFRARIHPDDYPLLKQADLDCIRGKTVRSTCRYRMKFGSDEWRWMQSDATVVDWDDDGRALRLVGAQTDVTDDIRSRNALRASEERFRVIFANAPVGKAVITNRGAFTSVNEAMCSLLGYEENELIRRGGLASIISRAELTEILAGIEQCRKNGEHRLEREKRLIHKKGFLIWTLISISWTMDGNEGEDFFIVQVSNIEEKKQIERMKSEFISTVSHELRTPLTAIRGALALLDNTSKADLSPTGVRLLGISQSNAERLIELVNNILDLERIDSGRLDFTFSGETISDVLEDAGFQSMALAERLGVELDIQSPEQEAKVWVDRARLSQVFGNLISNACKFSKPGDTVAVRAEITASHVKFLITDQGSGVPESFRQNIFKPFSQADSTDTREKGGTGLGLSITKRIIEHMDGEIGFESVPDQSTTFWFTCEQDFSREGADSKQSTQK